MARALSLDLRERVVEEVAKGTSCRQAAARFGRRNRGKRFWRVSASSAIRWAAKVGSGAALAPKKQGGDRRSQHLEAGAGFILGAAAEQPDITLAEPSGEAERARHGRRDRDALAFLPAS
jgi:transposase